MISWTSALFLLSVFTLAGCSSDEPPQNNSTRADGAAESMPLTGDLVTYTAGDGSVRLHDAIRLSDGTFVVVGGANHLDWLPGGVERITLTGFSGVQSSGSGRVAILLHLSSDLSQIVRVAHLPSDQTEDFRRIRATNSAELATDVLYVSAGRTTASTADDGYFIARLNGNFVDEIPSGADWTYDVGAKPRRAGGSRGRSAYKTIQPWDVDAVGRVVFGRGAEYDFDWASLHRLDASGALSVVEHWPAHWTDAGECHHTPASACGAPVSHSGVVLKAGRKGSLRSHSAEDYAWLGSDGNGRADRQGRWPDDYFFAGPCAADCAGGPGYTGYRTSDKPTQRLGAVVIDRNSGAIYLGLSTQSVLPDGLPDFEPSVVAFDDSGRLLWWNRLYEQTPANSTPDQYVDGLAIDAVSSSLIVLARCHGNNTVNLWRGDQIAAHPSASGFQNQFTGTNGNIHISWLGKFSLAEGVLRASTYVAEYTNTTGGLGDALGDPNLDGWQSPNGGWPDVNTTRCADVDVLSDGRVAITCTGRRTITTTNAHQKMLHFDEGVSKWNQFVRVYAADLSGIDYSTLVTGTWDAVEGPQSSNTVLQSVLPVDDGIIAAGWHQLDTETGRAKGNPVPTTAVPTWGASEPSGEAGLITHFSLKR